MINVDIEARLESENTPMVAIKFANQKKSFVFTTMSAKALAEKLIATAALAEYEAANVQTMEKAGCDKNVIVTHINNVRSELNKRKVSRN